jgi:hypothetical protein
MSIYARVHIKYNHFSNKISDKYRNKYPYARYPASTSWVKGEVILNLRWYIFLIKRKSSFNSGETWKASC